MMNVRTLENDPDNGVWVFEVPEQLVALVAALQPKQVADVVSVWTTHGGTPSLDPARLDWLQQFVRLCQHAKATGKLVGIWASR
jgi:hypothetical protein